MLYMKEIPEGKCASLVVCGGGFAGFASAYSAARQGVKTLLIERNGCLGGTGTQGLVNHLLGERVYQPDNTYKTCSAACFPNWSGAFWQPTAVLTSTGLI